MFNNSGPPPTEERIVMTPSKKSSNVTTIKMERVKSSHLDQNNIVHVAGGDHKGIIINRDAGAQDKEHSPPQLAVEFKVYLVNAITSTHTQEARQVGFWFKHNVDEDEQIRTAQDFFKELVSPMEFPRDYVGFIKKIMKLMQTRYPGMRRVEVELKQLEDIPHPPTQPISLDALDDDRSCRSEMFVSTSRVLELIESAYPNPITITEIAKQTKCGEEDINNSVIELVQKGLIKSVEGGNRKGFVRALQNDTEVKVVRQMPTVVSSQQPTIAIITAHFCEKVAVDAMIENKDTYVRYTTVGESNVYTLGNIGAHRVVATKLPTVGHSRAAMIAAGNTTTRLLGSFQKVDYVFLVGVGGGVPHFTDPNRHVRLGDIVVSAPPVGKKYIYAYCEQANRLSNGKYNFEAKTWSPPTLQIQQVAKQLHEQTQSDPKRSPWLSYLHKGMEELRSHESDFSKPPSDTDKLFMSIGGKDMIEVSHPEGNHQRDANIPRIHFGAVGSGRHIVKDEEVRQEFAQEYGVLAYDTEFDSVAESIYGNRKDSYVFIRGISDYRDGIKKKDWQPYSSLVAASFMKAVICTLPMMD